MAIHLHVDPFNGIAGDMFLAALIHVGVPTAVIQKQLAKLPIKEPFLLKVTPVCRLGIEGIDLKVDAVTSSVHRRYRDLLDLIDHLEISDRGQANTRRIIHALAKAEAAVHGQSIDNVHFHEVGAIDSIVDLLGSAVALEWLDVQTVSCGPLPISRGFVQCAHGTLPVPAPATAYLLKGVATVGVDRTGELVTPTGAALMVGLGAHFGPPPPMVVKAVGYGAGDREDPVVPNLLRLVLGEV